MSLVTEHLADQDIDFTAYDHPRTFTSIAEARALGIDADEVAKTIVLDVGEGHVVACIPADRRLDVRLVREAVDDGDARLATEEEISRDFPRFELGAVPPLPGLIRAPVLIDPEITLHDTVVFASGKQTESVRMHVSDLLAEADVRVARLADLGDDTPAAV